MRLAPRTGPVAAILTLAALSAGVDARRVQVRRQAGDNSIAQSSDVAWLESIAGSADGADVYMRDHRVRFGQAKDWRTAAFARLGDLGTKESLAAVRRIEAQARTLVPAPPRVRLGTAPSPGWHMGDGQLRPVAQIRSGDGATYSVVVGNLVGGFGLFLVSTSDPEDPGGWTRPKRIPAAVYRGSRFPSLAWKSPGVLLLHFEQGTPPPRGIMEGTLNPVPMPPSLGPQTLEIVVGDVERDSDKDGWTDIEESVLGLDPRNPDTDGDGIPDGADVCPNYAPAPGDAADESVQIIQKAVLATFGLTRSMEPLYPSPESRKVQLWGYRAPVVYGRSHPTWSPAPSAADSPEGQVFVTWKVARKTPDEALVVLSDSEGPLAAGGQEVTLAKRNGEWFVVARATTWIS